MDFLSPFGRVFTFESDLIVSWMKIHATFEIYVFVTDCTWNTCTRIPELKQRISSQKPFQSERSGAFFGVVSANGHQTPIFNKHTHHILWYNRPNRQISFVVWSRFTCNVIAKIKCVKWQKLKMAGVHLNRSTDLNLIHSFAYTYIFELIRTHGNIHTIHASLWFSEMEAMESTWAWVSQCCHAHIVS